MATLSALVVARNEEARLAACLEKLAFADELVVVLDRSTPQSFGEFEKAIAKLKFVLDCHLVAGDFDYFLKIRVKDIEGFNRMHGEKLIALPGVRQTRTFFVMKEVIDNAPLDF